MNKLRKEWRDKLVEELRELINPAKILHEHCKEHPDISYLLEDVIQVLQGYDGGRSYISGNEGLELSRLHGLLQWIAKKPEDSKVVPSNEPDNSPEVTKELQVIKALRISVSSSADYEK